MTYRLVVGTPQPSIAADLRALLAESGEFDVLDVVESSQEVEPTVHRRDADVVVLDERLGPLPVNDLVRQLGMRFPYVAVVLVVSAESPGMMQAAMEAGARAIVTLPLTFESVNARLTNAASWSRAIRSIVSGDTSRLEQQAGSMVVLAGAKGGVGTTSLAVHLALLAVSEGRRACLVDLDLQNGDVANLLDLTYRRDISQLVDVAADLGGRALDDALFSHSSGLRLLLSPQHGERAEDVNGKVARAVLGALRSRFDVVVVDCGSVMTEATAVAVEMAEQVVVVVTPDVLAMRGARRLLRLWDRLQLRRDDEVTLVLNRVSKHSEVQPELARRIVGAPLCDVSVPAAFRALEPAVNAGDPARVIDATVRRAIAALGAKLGVVASGAAVAPSSGRRRRGDHGQVAIEALAMLVLFLAVVLVLVQLVLYGYTFVLAGDAANAAARRAAVVAPSDPTAGQQVLSAAQARLPGAWKDAGTDVTPPDADGTVVIHQQVPSIVPGLSLTVTSKAAMGRG